MVVMHFGKSVLKPHCREIFQIVSKPERPLISKYLDLFGEDLVFKVSCELECSWHTSASCVGFFFFAKREYVHRIINIITCI